MREFCKAVRKTSKVLFKNKSQNIGGKLSVAADESTWFSAVPLRTVKKLLNFRICIHCVQQVYLGYNHNKSLHCWRITCLSSREGEGEKWNLLFTTSVHNMRKLWEMYPNYIIVGHLRLILVVHPDELDRELKVTSVVVYMLQAGQHFLNHRYRTRCRLWFITWYEQKYGRWTRK